MPVAPCRLDEEPPLEEPTRRLAARMAEKRLVDLQPLDWFFFAFTAYHVGGETWKPVAKRIQLIAKHAGGVASFPWTGEWDGAGGASCSGALHFLSLTLYYRYFRLVNSDS